MAKDDDPIARINERIDDLDLELFCVQRTAYNSFWPSVAVAAALIDQGVMSKDGLLDIIEALHDVAAGLVERGYAEDDLLALEEFRGAIEGLELAEGLVLQQLRRQGAAGALAVVLQALQRKRDEPPPDPL